ncbi:hypothetical protein ALC60_00362 [Trachymyrmex zeteki]|uniref:Double jelly roll-like domain-containing protein n=1 Tax=Mycetomoellerius zeteki TaxID=64791 RepID=A0A151XJI8_9HYME|nr:hypothetical protein ALC60_00362 [Trachymyrmex zeteki]
MTDIQNIKDNPIFDDRIVKFETYTYNPFANITFGYILNGMEIDHNRNVGVTIKNYVSLTYDKYLIALNAGWNTRSDTEERYFNFCVPLNILLGFCKDYKRVIVNAHHELILIRSHNDNNCLIGDPATEPMPTLELFKVQWRIPYVLLSEINKLSMLRALENGRYLSMSFRSWNLYEYPLLQNTTKHSWAIKTATQLEKPRYVIFALQTGRKNVMKENVPMNTTAYCLITHDRVIQYNPLTNFVRKIT